MSLKLSWALFLWENIGPIFLVHGHVRFSLLRSAKGTYEFKREGNFQGRCRTQPSVSPFNRHVTHGDGRSQDFAFYTQGKL
jgi:hypothetical protein